jgi:hypothetical protein
LGIRVSSSIPAPKLPRPQRIYTDKKTLLENKILPVRLHLDINMPQLIPGVWKATVC